MRKKLIWGQLFGDLISFAMAYARLVFIWDSWISCLECYRRAIALQRWVLLHWLVLVGWERDPGCVWAATSLVSLRGRSVLWGHLGALFHSRQCAWRTASVWGSGSGSGSGLGRPPSQHQKTGHMQGGAGRSAGHSCNQCARRRVCHNPSFLGRCVPDAAGEEGGPSVRPSLRDSALLKRVRSAPTTDASCALSMWGSVWAVLPGSTALCHPNSSQFAARARQCTLDLETPPYLASTRPDDCASVSNTRRRRCSLRRACFGSHLKKVWVPACRAIQKSFRCRSESQTDWFIQRRTSDHEHPWEWRHISPVHPFHYEILFFILWNCFANFFSKPIKK